MTESTKKIVQKPWGHEEIFAVTRDYVGKILFIKAGHQLSLQFHKVKEESIYLQTGQMDLLLENERGELETLRLTSGMTAHIPTQKKHRMTAVSDCTVFEVSTPHLDDVVRLDDRYGRVEDHQKST